ncbi:hypothetical protein [Propionivibrio sp.]|uniref:hypothetical protein n=1 Tax=Propionivibrio sp. TaxID=2212460 RepID=UPI003BF311FB
MANFTDLTGLGGIALALAMLSGLALLRRQVSKRLSSLLAGAIFVALLVPFGELPPAAYVRGMIGDLSVTTLFILAYVYGHRLLGWPRLEAQQRSGLLLLLVLAACALYPLALGADMYDPYRLGYGEPWFLVLLLALALAGVALRMPLVALPISLAVLAWTIGWYESGNLWDYLIDPLLAIYAVFGCLSASCSLCRKRGSEHG